MRLVRFRGPDGVHFGAYDKASITRLTGSFEVAFHQRSHISLLAGVGSFDHSANESEKAFIAGDEVGFTVDFNNNAVAAVVGQANRDNAVSSGTTRFLGGLHAA